MCNHIKYLQKAAEVAASDSTTKIKLGAVLRIKKRTVSKSGSKWDRQTFNGTLLSNTAHAEMMTILNSSKRARKALPSLLAYFGGIKYSENTECKVWRRAKLSGSVLYVARIGHNDNGDIVLRNARPCTICIDFMLMYGIEKICYSTGDDDEYRIVKVRDLANEPRFITHVTRILSGQRYE